MKHGWEKWNPKDHRGHQSPLQMAVAWAIPKCPKVLILICCLFISKIVKALHTILWSIFEIMVILIHGGYCMRDTWISGRLYALQKAMEIDRKAPECRNFLAALMNLLETVISSHNFFKCPIKKCTLHHMWPCLGKLSQSRKFCKVSLIFALNTTDIVS